MEKKNGAINIPSIESILRLKNYVIMIDNVSFFQSQPPKFAGETAVASTEKIQTQSPQAHQTNSFNRVCCGVREKPALGLRTFSVERYSIVHDCMTTRASRKVLDVGDSQELELACRCFEYDGPWMISEYFT